MANSEAAAGTPAEPTNAPQAGNGQASEHEQPQAGGSESAAQEELKRVRQEAANYRRRLREFEDAKKAADDAALSEADLLKKRVKELEDSERTAQAVARTLRLRSAVEREAYKRQFADAADAYRLIDHDAIELNDDGEPTNVGTLLEALVKAKPYLLVAQPTTGTALPVAGVPASPRPTSPQQVTEARRRQEEIEATHHVGRLWGRAPRT